MNELNPLEKNQIISVSSQFKIDYGKAFLVTLIIISCLVVTGMIINFPAEFWKGFYHISLPLSFLAGGILAIIVLLIYLKARWADIFTHIKNTPKFWVVFLCILFYAGTFPFAEFLMSIFPTTGNKFLEELYKSTIQGFEMMLDYKVAGFITVCIIAPIFEEILFRGILFRGMLQNGMKPAAAIIFSSLLFGLSHMNPWQFLGAGILGVVFAFVYYRTRSLWLCIFLHALNNTVSFILMIRFQSMEKNVTNPNDYVFILISLGIALLLGFGIYKLTPAVKWN